MENEKNTQNQFVEYIYDFRQVSFTDAVSVEDFKIMCEETINRCFDGEKIIPYMVDISPYMTLLKHCSNFPTEEFTEDELYLMCLYSNLEEVLELLNEQNDNKLYFILQNLEDCIKYEQDRINHKNKLNDIIEELISYISENANDIKNVASELLNTYKEETPQDQVDNIVKEK